jgi:DivIVA domain-containing protein
VLLVLVVVLVVAALVFGVVSLLSGDDPGLGAAEPDGRAVPLPNNRSLTEGDLKAVRFDVGWRGYRMAQVDRVLRRTAYDVGYKDEMIAVLEAEVTALREGRTEDAELFRKARESASNPAAATAVSATEVVVADGGVPAEGLHSLALGHGPETPDEPDSATAPVETAMPGRDAGPPSAAETRAAETNADETGAPAADRA